METTNNYITPDKHNLIFIAECTYFGYIEDACYKEYSITINNCEYIGRTFAISYNEAINKLHNWIIENKDILSEYPKCKFNIYYINGTIEKRFEEVKHYKVYSISAKQAKFLLF